MTRALALLIVAAVAMGVVAAQSVAPVRYDVSFPEPEHHWLQVVATFPGLGRDPLRVRMSRSSPGRYAVHEFAKNIFSLSATDGTGRTLPVTRPDVDEWRVSGHNGTVRITYRIFGDEPDGTWFGVDTTHAHINMPATFVWAVGQEMKPIRIAFQAPQDSGWRAATQLFPTNEPFTFTAPNLQYFMDSPTELAPLLFGGFTVQGASGAGSQIRLAVHTEDTQADVDALATLVNRLVREEAAVFGELPSFEPGEYTFLLDYVPWGGDDGMEHRNSTTISVPWVSLRTPQGRMQALDTMAHEFFHIWNVERIRPAGLEPFDFTRQNITCCLWLAEGFTQYYGELLLRRAGFGNQLPAASYVTEVVNGSGRQVRSAVQMSEYGPFADGNSSAAGSDANRTFISYYTLGAAIALGMDLSIRDISGGRLSLDDYMRRLWVTFGKPSDARPGFVARPYSLSDLRTALADVTGNTQFATSFFERFIEGREPIDYARLLALAGYIVRPGSPDRGWLGNVPMNETSAGLVVGVRFGSEQPVPFGTPLYDAGIDAGDVIASIDGQPATIDLWNALGTKRPGDRVSLVVKRRDGRTLNAMATVRADPRLQVVAAEAVGSTLSDAQRAFRSAWLSSAVR